MKLPLPTNAFRSLLLSLGIVSTVFSGAGILAAEIQFNRDIRPILSDRCFHCHGPDEHERKGDLRLDQTGGPEGAYRDHEGSIAIQPGSLEKSELWARIISDDPDEVMPPPKGHKKSLTESEIALFKQWIEEGATYQEFWAFVPPSLPSLPFGEEGKPIDQFVRRKLESEGLSPAPKADRRTLIRRLSFDLTGLPPTRDEIAAFLADESPDAYEKLVDGLLESPHYGEHLARYWLDLVRFADTNGIHHDHYREMSPYRDWVIRAFNDNLPYDDFTRFQLAGDLYPEASRDQLVASGFNRLHLIIDRGTALPEESFTRNVIDRVTSVGTAFMGLTVQCAVCHDHKYDPLTAEDFYSLSAFFNNLDAEPETGGRSGTDFMRGLQAPYISLATPEEEARLAVLTKKTKATSAALTRARAALKQEVTDEVTKKELAAEVKKAEQQDKAAKSARDQFELTLRTAMVITPEEEAQLAELTKKAEATSAELARVRAALKQKIADDTKKKALAAKVQKAEQQDKVAKSARDQFELTLPAAMVMRERTEPRPTHILVRGAYDNPGDVVGRNTPAFLPPMKTGTEQKSRLDLANWLVDPENPLTARVAVNRFWQQVFGVGIVRTSEDFGAQGEWPTHPDLLDYLAVRFLESGWNIKSLLKEIVTSDTYRQSSFASQDVFKHDPENRLLSRGSRFRMDSEMIRDQVLASSGLLNPELFGKSVKPPQPEGLWKSVGMPSSYPKEFVPDAGDKRYRRSVYTFWKRGMPPPQMTILNAPSREECISRRERTNTPLQALLLMNESEYLKAAQHLAHALIESSDQTPGDRVDAIYEKVTSDLPDEDEKEAYLQLYHDLLVLYRESPKLAELIQGGLSIPEKSSPADLAAWTMLTSAIYNLDITKTRQ